MGSFHDRIDVARITEIWQLIRDSYYLSDQNAVIVHDLGLMKNRIQLLQDAFPQNTIHALAIKANPLVEVLRCAVACGAGLEAASIEEVQCAIEAGCDPAKIVFDSPAKTVSEINHALELGVHLNIDNFSELDRIALSLTNTPSRSSVGLRVNPEVGTGTISHTSVGGVGSKFGVSISRERKRILDVFRQHNWLSGLHVHVGSQGCSLDLLCSAATKINELFREIQAQGSEVSIVNIGGGLPAAYREQDDPPLPQEYSQELTKAAPDLLGGKLQLMTEFGRSVQAGCGLAFAKVEYVRPSQSTGGETMAVVHLGADFLLRPVYRANDWSHEFMLIGADGQPKASGNSRVSIAGPLCFSGDFIGRNLSLPAPVAGDWIVIRDCGAYTLSMWSRHCSRGIPTVLGVENQDLSLLRKAESPNDVARYWSTAGISD